jgi:hypothetical protein
MSVGLETRISSKWYVGSSATAGVPDAREVTAMTAAEMAAHLIRGVVRDDRHGS